MITSALFSGEMWMGPLHTYTQSKTATETKYLSALVPRAYRLRVVRVSARKIKAPTLGILPIIVVVPKRRLLHRRVIAPLHDKRVRKDRRGNASQSQERQTQVRWEEHG